MAGTVSKAVKAPSQIAGTVTKHGGPVKAALAAELVTGFVILGIRVAGDFEVQSDGTVAGKVLHPSGQYGPLPVAVGLLGSFFILSLAAAGGGVRARVAAVFGALIIIMLGMNSATEINALSSTLGSIGKVAVPAASGAEPGGLATTASGGITAPASGGNAGTPANPQIPAAGGWKAVPNTHNLEVYPINGTCPAGWRLVNDRCISPSDVVTAPES